jgi:hypothetical protein
VWETRLRVFQAAVGAFWASTAAAPSTASVLSRPGALPQSIALARHLDDDGVREEAIENRRCRRDVAEEDPPVLRRSIGRDERRRRFVPAHEDFQEVLGGVRSQLLHPEVLEHQEVDAGELLHKLAAGASGVGLREIGRQVEGTANECAVAGANSADGDGSGDMRFADTGRTDEQHTGVCLDEACAGQFDDLGFRNLGIEGPVEVGQRLHDGDAGLFEPAGEEPVRAPRELVLDEQFEKLEMRERGGFRLGDATRQGIDDAGESEMAQSGRELWIHCRKSSKVYWVMGRIAGSSVTSPGVGRAGVRSTSWRMV